jgi:hypothetical protein
MPRLDWNNSTVLALPPADIPKAARQRRTPKRERFDEAKKSDPGFGEL